MRRGPIKVGVGSKRIGGNSREETLLQGPKPGSKRNVLKGRMVFYKSRRQPEGKKESSIDVKGEVAAMGGTPLFCRLVWLWAEE